LTNAKHIKKSNGQEILRNKCEICNEKLKAKFGELAHIANMHTSDIVGSFTYCVNCEKELPGFLYERHLPYCESKEEKMNRLKLKRNESVKKFYKKRKAKELEQKNEKIEIEKNI
jgi:hypothetical protein